MKFTVVVAAGITFIETTFWFIALILPITIVIILLLVFRVIRYFIGVYLSCYHGQKIEFLSGLDTLFCIGVNRSECLTHINTIFDGKLDFDRVRSLLQRMCEEKDVKTGRWIHPRLRSCIHQRYGYSYLLLQEDFKLDDHVWVHGEPFPSNVEELHVEYEKLYHKPTFKSITPPWYYVFIPLADNFVGLNPGPHFVMVHAIHHSLSDGLAMLNTTNRYLMDKSWNEFSSTSFSKSKIEQSNIKPILQRIKTVFTIPMALAKNEMTEGHHHALHPPILTGKKVGKVSPALSLARIKSIKNATGTTVNDVMLSLIAGCLRSYFLRAGIHHFPQVMRLAVPVARHDLSKPPVFENQCSFACWNIPVREETPLDRLMVAHKTMDEIKNSPILIANYVILKLLVNTLPSCFFPSLSKHTLTGFASNIPGGQTDCSMAGSTVSSMFFFTEINAALNFTIMSWSDWFQIRIAADTAIMTNEQFVDNLLEDFMNGIDELEKDLNNRSKNHDCQSPNKNEKCTRGNIV